MTEHVLIEKAAGVLTLTLNRPEKKNALTREMYAAVGDATDAANECHACNLSYPVIGGIPTFIPAEATPLADDRRTARR